MASHEPERRAAPRAATSRDALFAGMEDEGLPRQGRAVDLSRDGLQIHTDQPESVGASNPHPREPLDGASRLLRERVERKESAGSRFRGKAREDAVTSAAADPE